MRNMTMLKSINRTGVTERCTAVKIAGRVLRDLDTEKYENDEMIIGTSRGFGRAIERKLKDGSYWNK